METMREKGGPMERSIHSEGVCVHCAGERVAFLWAKDSNQEGRWVINEAVNPNEKSLNSCDCNSN